MARKRRTDEEGLPASPLAAKLAQEVTQVRRTVQPTAVVPRQVAQDSADLEVYETPQAAKTEKKALPRKKPSRTHKHKESRVMLDADEWVMKGEVITALRSATSEQVEFSHLMRSLLGLASSAIPAIETNANHATLPPRPANNDLMALAAFEDELGKFLLLAFRDKKAMDSD